MDILLAVLLTILGLGIGAALGYFFHRHTVNLKIGNTEQTVQKMLNDAKDKAESIRKERIIEAKEEVHRLRSEVDRESRERRNEIQRAERRVVQREELLDKKTDSLAAREEQLTKRTEDVVKLEESIQELHTQQTKELERISGLTCDEAREIILANVEKDTRYEAAVLMKEIETKAREEAEKKAKYIISMAIQKCAADQVAEATVSVVPLPNDEMKGRIIGREGRNAPWRPPPASI